MSEFHQNKNILSKENEHDKKYPTNNNKKRKLNVVSNQNQEQHCHITDKKVSHKRLRIQ